MGTRPLMHTPPTGAQVSVLPDTESLALAAATLIVEEARRAVQERGRFTIALSGGSTPRPVYRLLAAPPLAELMPWQALEVFWGDERCVDAADPRSNERMAREALLDNVPIPAERVHPMRCGRADDADTAGEGAPGEAAARRAAEGYERLLRGFFGAARPAGGGPAGLDLVLLGLGDNGHTASLFPGSEALEERERWVAGALEDPDTAMITSKTGERLWRVTLTAPFINRAALVVFVASGAAKAAVVAKAVQGKGNPRELPALLVQPAPGRLVWLLDQQAASRLDVVTRPGSGPVSGEEAAAAAAGDAGTAESYEDLPHRTEGPAR